VHYLRYEGHILFEEDIAHTQDYELIKIAELLHAGEGPGAFLSTRYIPPCLTVHASPVLERMLKDMRELLTAKGRELAEYKGQHKIHPLEMGSRETVLLVMMQTISRYIPLFHHHLEGEETTPRIFYALVRQLVGELSTFSETVSALGDPPHPLKAYRHDTLWECFDPALKIAKELLKEVAPGPNCIVPLDYDGQYFTATLDEQFFTGNNRYYLSIKVDMLPGDLRPLLTETGKISSREAMEQLLRQALPGVSIEYLESPPAELPRRAHYRYFLINHHDPHWRNIEQDRNIAVCCALTRDQADMQLLVICGT
jgi:type VI secretion system protein ImpJ